MYSADLLKMHFTNCIIEKDPLEAIETLLYTLISPSFWFKYEFWKVKNNSHMHNNQLYLLHLMSLIFTVLLSPSRFN